MGLAFGVADWGREKEPWAITAPVGVSPIPDCAEERIVEGIPNPSNEKQSSGEGARQAENIGVENQQVSAEQCVD